MDTYSDTTALLIFCTCPNSEAAERVAETIVAERLAACVNILPGLASIYRWQGRVERDQELLLLIKTQAACYTALEKRIVELHPYDVPEVIAIPIAQGLPAYLEWIQHSTKGLKG